ncbi:MAG: FtsX-like permease family protein, partial [Bacteroidota bacterium]
GRFLNEKDLTDYRKVAVIGQRVQELLFEEEEDPIGEYIKVNGLYFQVVGVFKTRQTGDAAERETQKVFLPFSTFQKAFNYGNRVSWFSINAGKDQDGYVMEEKVLSIMRRRHSVSPDDERAFGHYNRIEEFEKPNNVLFGIRVLSWIVGFFTLLAGAIGISNIMLVVVKERTKEIGVRRAIGAKPWSIISMIIAEAVLLTFMAGFCGLISSVALLDLAASFMEGQDTGMFGPPSVDIAFTTQALIILVVAGVLAGLIPAQRAIRIRPVEALRAD